MPRDLFAETAPQPSPGAPRDLLAEAPQPQPAAVPQVAPSGIGARLLSADTRILHALHDTVMGAGVGTVQGLANMGYGLLDLGQKAIDPVIEKITGKAVPQIPAPNVYLGPYEHYKGTIPAELGEHVLGPVLGTVAAPESIAGLSGIKGIAALPKLQRMLAYGGIQAATQPGGLTERGIAGLLGAGMPLAGHVASRLISTTPKFISSAPYFLIRKLASAIEKSHSANKEISKGLYDEAFKGVENTVPKIGAATQEAFDEIKNLWTTKTSVVRKLLARYENNPRPTVEVLHKLKSDLNKERFKLKGAKNFNSIVSDRVDALESAVEGISDDLANSVSPENHSKYLLAQKYWKDNIVPFDEYRSIQDLLSRKRKITPRLYTDLTEISEPGNTLRRLLKTDLGTMQLARIFHHRIGKYALPALLALPAGYALYHHHSLGEY